MLLSREVAYKLAASRVAFFFAIGLAMFPGATAGLYGLSLAQQSFFPIIDRFVVSEMTTDESGDVTISGSFYKRYPDWVCEYRGMQWFMPGIAPDGSEMRYRINSTYGDKRQDAAQNNRQNGYNPFRGWVIGASEYPDMATIAGFVTHECLWFIPTRTYFPEIQVSEVGIG